MGANFFTARKSVRLHFFHKGPKLFLVVII